MRCSIIGGGIAGMSAALLLNKLGHDVVLFESSPHLAPLIKGFTRQGLHFDTGLHYIGGLGSNGSLRLWLKAMEVELPEDSILPCREEFFFGQKHMASLACNEQTWYDTIAAEAPNAPADMQRLFDIMRQNCRHSAYLSPENDILPSMPWAEAKEGDIFSFLQMLSLPEKWKNILLAHCLLFDVIPQDASISAFSLVSWPYMSEGKILRGGGQQLHSAFTTALAQSSVQVHTATRISQIRIEQKKVCAVCSASGQEFATDACLHTGHPGQLERLLPKGTLRPAFFTHIQGMADSSPAFMVFAETCCPELDGSVSWLLPSDSPHYRACPLEGDTPTIFISVGDAVRGRRPLNLVATATEPEQISEANFARWKKNMSDKALATVAARLPFLQDMKLIAASSARDMRHWLHGSTGSLYGIRHCRNDIPVLPVTKVKGLWLAGQHILLPGILGAIVSAAIAAGMAAGHDAVLSLFRSSKDPYRL